MIVRVANKNFHLGRIFGVALVLLASVLCLYSLREQDKIGYRENQYQVNIDDWNFSYEDKKDGKFFRKFKDVKNARKENLSDFEVAKATINQRIKNHQEQCQKYSDPFRPESNILTTKPSSFGSEVVYLHGKKHTASICIPHKVGSHAWGKFATIFNDKHYKNLREQKEFLSLDFESRASKSVRVIVVRHPLDRLLSVYQMIFENWCDKDRWLAKQWDNVCTEEVTKDDLNDTQNGFSKSLANNGTKIYSEAGNKGYREANTPDFSASNFLKSMIDEKRHGNDRYIKKIWNKFHPDEIQSIENKNYLRFTFGEFARFIVNGSIEFANDNYILNHRGLSYHWAPYWKECDSCSELTKPHFIVHLKTLRDDLKVLVSHIQGDLQANETSSIVDQFPHTHSSDSYPRADRFKKEEDKRRKYFSTLTKSDIEELYNKYELDHLLFGYSLNDFIKYV